MQKRIGVNDAQHCCLMYYCPSSVRLINAQLLTLIFHLRAAAAAVWKHGYHRSGSCRGFKKQMSLLLQALATELQIQALGLQQCGNIALSLRTGNGCELAEMLARQGLRCLHDKAASDAIALLDSAHALIGELELDTDDPSFEQQSARVRSCYDKVSAVLAPPQKA